MCGAGVGTNGSNAAQGIAVGASAVYWTSSNLNGLFARPLGSDAGASALFASAGSPGAVAVDTDGVYFASTDDGGSALPMRGDRLRADAQLSWPRASAPSPSLAVDATRVYAV